MAVSRSTREARMVFDGVTPTQGYRLTTAQRDATGVYSSAGSITYPNAYVRLTRQGNVFTGYSSPDGVNWTATGRLRSRCRT